MVFAPSQLSHIGHVEKCSDGIVSGWAWDPSDENRSLAVNISFDGNVVAEVSCSEFREDLLAAGIGNGCFGFRYESPEDFSSKNVTVTIAGDGTHLNIYDPKLAKSHVERYFGHVETCFNRVILGWARDPDAPTSRLAIDIRIDGSLISTVTADHFRMDLANAGVGDGRHGFEFIAETDLDGKTIKVSLTNGGSELAIDDERYVAPIISSQSELRSGILPIASQSQANVDCIDESETKSSADFLSRSDEISRIFDGTWYSKIYMTPEESAIDPLDHFLTIGMTEGHNPNSLFLSDWYFKRNIPATGEPIHPLIHFLDHGWREGRQPHPLFHTVWYANQYGGLANLKLNVLEHFFTIALKTGMKATPIFDDAWYRSSYTDAKNSENAFIHFVETGSALGYNPNAFFDHDYYLSQFPGLKQSGENPLVHYLETGATAGRDPSPNFSTSGYLRAYPDVGRENRNPLEHFMRSGVKEGRDPMGRVASRPQITSNLPIFSRFGGTEYGPIEKVLPYFSMSPPPAQNFDVCVHIHLYHGDLAEEFINYLSNLEFDFTLLLSVQENDQTEWSNFFKSRLARVKTCVARNVINVGRDVSPWAIAFADEILKHDIFFHGHTKKSTYDKKYAGWRRFLAHNTIGSKSIVAEIMNLFDQNAKLGLVYPAYFPSLPSQPSWGGCREKAEKLAKQMGAPSPSANCPDYPSGSFFWATVEYLRPLLTCGLTYADFDEEIGQLDGTLAHAIERVLGELGKVTGLGKLCTTVDVGYNLVEFWDNKRIAKVIQPDTAVAAYETKSEPLGDSRRIAVYTCVTGGFDEFTRPIVVHPDVDYFVFSDAPLADTGHYINKLCQYRDVNPRRTARYVKTHPHVLLPGYDVAIWVDANIMFRTSLAPVIKSVDDAKADLGVIFHSTRTSFAAEAEECARIGADDTDVLQEQVERYRTMGLTEDRLIETNVIVAMHSPQVSKFFNAWWQEIAQFSLRDQVSVNYAAEVAKLKIVEIVEIGKTVRDDHRFIIFNHEVRQRNAVVGFVIKAERSAGTGSALQ